MDSRGHDAYAEHKTAEVLAELHQRLVALPTADTEALLSDASHTLHGDDGRSGAASIISRLYELNPDIARQFHPKQQASPTLRMILRAAQSEAQGRSSHVVSSFIAVSYCWHYPGWPLAPAATEIARGWEISKPMMDAVMALRNNATEGVWIDKLCINQDDESDKTAHIGIMDIIYGAARRIAILLEDIQLDQSEETAALIYVRFFAGLRRRAAKPGVDGQEKVKLMREYLPRRELGYRRNNREDILAAAKPFAMKILGARWFSRAWCAHESRTTRHRKVNNPLFLCFGSGGQVLSFEFRFIHFLARYLYLSEAPEPFSGEDPMRTFNDPDPNTLGQRWMRIQRLMPATGPDSSAMQHLVNVLPFGCVYKRDLMSIALNTAKVPLYFSGKNIWCVEDVVWIFSSLILASGDLVPLVMSGSKLRIPEDGGNTIISWATNPDLGILDSRLPNRLPRSITAVTREYIELDLLVFESNPTPATPESRSRASGLIEAHDLYTLADAFLVDAPQTIQSTVHILTTQMSRARHDPSPFHSFIHNMLSLSLDNGLPWILNFPRAMYQATHDSWLHGTLGEATDARLLPAARALLAHYSFPDDARRSEVSEEGEQDMIGGLAQFLTTLLDPRLLFLTTGPRRLPFAIGCGTATATAAIVPSTSNRSYLAVPAVLAHLPAWHDRAWVVEPFDPFSASPAETLADFFPSGEVRVAREGEDVTAKMADVMPVLSSDDEDRRAKMMMPDGGSEGEKRGAWRLRSKQVLYGCAAGELVEMVDSLLLRENGGRVGGPMGQGVVLLRRQRVYGAEDYPWGEIHKAMRRMLGEGGGGQATE